MYICVYIYIYIYIHIIKELASEYPAPRPPAHGALGEGQMGSALMGSLEISWFLTEGFFR